MIKKILLGLMVLVGVGLTSFGFCGVLYKEFNVNEELMLPNSSIYSFKPVSSSAGVVIGGGITKPLMISYSYQNSYITPTVYYWGLDKKLYYYGNNGRNTDSFGVVDRVCVYNSSNWVNYSPVNLADNTYCNGGGESVDFDTYLSNPDLLAGNMTRAAVFYYTPGGYGYGSYCFIYDGLNLSLCFGKLEDLGTPPVGVSFSPVEFNQSLIGTSPFVSGGGGSFSGGSGGVIDLTDNDYIGYFENRSVESFNVSDCYVGTNDLTSPYGTAGLSFNYGKGKTIFDLYDSLYGSGTGSSYLNNVATWTRTWKLNYGNWFDRNSVGYMGVFSEFTLNGVEFLPRDYTGFIFSGRPASLYFMANNLYDKFGFYGDTFELVGYCDMKLNGTPFNEVFSPGSATYNNVLGTTYSNYYNRQYYVDGSGNLVLSREPGDFNIYLSEWLNYNLTGEDYGDYFDGFSNFYDKLDEKFSNINLSNSVGIIPEYILFALFGIILFKIFKH